MTYSKLGNIKGPQGRRGLNMTGGATTPPAVDDSVLEGDLWLDSVTGDVYRATDPSWVKDGSWRTWGTVLWKVADNILMVQPAEGDTGTTGKPADFNYSQGAPWCDSADNPSRGSMISVRSKGAIAMNANSEGMFAFCSAFTEVPSAISGWDIPDGTSMEAMFYDCSALTDISALSGWDTSGVTNMRYMFSDCSALTDLSALSGWNTSGVTSMDTMFYNCSALADISALPGWDVSGVTSMTYMFYNCPLKRIGIPSLDHGGRKFVSNLSIANAVTNMNTTMLTNTTTHETMSANQMLTDMDSNPSKYATGTVWTL